MKKGSPAMTIGFNEDLTTKILLRLPAKTVLKLKTVSKQWLSHLRLKIFCVSFPLPTHTRKSASPAIAIGYNEDLTTEILLRLPAKSVLRFKTVSKQWLSIVSSPRFRQIHASGIGSATRLFWQKYEPRDHKLEFFPLDNQISPLPNIISLFDYPIIIRSSSGGLLLLLRWQPYNRFKYDRDYFVCNPTTKEFKPLAVPQLIRDSEYVSETLAFDPSKSPHYKVVFSCKYYELYYESQIVIYSSETKTFSSPAITSVNFCFCGIYCNDAIHWISHLKTSLYYLDLSRECMNESPLPPHLVGRVQYFGEWQGHLHLVIFLPSQISLLEVYELKRDYSGWSLKYQIDLASIPIELQLPQTIISPIRFYQLTVLSIFADEEEELTMVFVMQNIIVAYNFKKKLCNVLRPFDRRRVYSCWPITYEYIETLACV